MQFKKGDRVRVVSFPDPTHVGAEGVVEGPSTSGRYVLVGTEGYSRRYFERELELVPVLPQVGDIVTGWAGPDRDYTCRFEGDVVVAVDPEADFPVITSNGKQTGKFFATTLTFRSPETTPEKLDAARRQLVDEIHRLIPDEKIGPVLPLVWAYGARAYENGEESGRAETEKDVDHSRLYAAGLEGRLEEIARIALDQPADVDESDIPF